MGTLLSLLNDKGPVPKVDFYVDFESAQPSDAEKQIYSKVDVILAKAPGIVEELKSYQGAGEAIREAISNPTSPDHQAKAWTLVCPLVQQLRTYYDYSQDLQKALCEILSDLCSPDTSAIQNLETKQAITKQLAHILDFTLMFDNLKMNNPQIQNDFSYYRRTLNRRKMEDVTQGVSSGPELPDDVANRMSLFYANPTPMLNTLATGAADLVADNPRVTLETTTESLSTMASICRVLNENPEYKSRFRNEETISFTLRVMVGIIILYDHLHPVGAFAKKAAIDMKASIKVIRDHPKHSDGLLNALKYNTKHFNDEATPKATKIMMS